MVFDFEPVPLDLPEGVPLYKDERGTVRVRNSRVLLDLVVGEHSLGSSPAKIAWQYPTVNADDVAAVLDYYRDNKDEVDEYLRIRCEQGDRIKAYFESQPEYIARRKRLLEWAREKGLR